MYLVTLSLDVNDYISLEDIEQSQSNEIDFEKPWTKDVTAEDLEMYL